MPATCSTMLSPSGVHVDAESELSSRCAHASGSESADTSSLPRSKSPTRKEERLTTDANTGRPAQSELGILEHVPPQLNQGDSRGAEDGRGYRH
jgi:hypothetical protein